MANEIKKIFIADDDEAIVDATVMMLEVMGYEVKYTFNGATVTEAINDRPDLVLLDIWMSGIDGRDICKQIKANPKTSQIPVIMVSASRDIAQSALDAGADGFLEKPFEMDALINKIESLLT
ncbi:response regulator transcription factor [Pedobacter metabolipauper]|uniref:Two-component system alkaline phosphatase synthesis response regulator PhoP n=1 Tax=Pedobacter metabolipauper TaxID=425513 RepID=A0A4R6T0Q6_9SPHI|nr:response regulator transcription factor [Pedobacter metabolipauper]TDQ11060.1 two-component system alkaline phosphatase synthesis response regulator PhoP [Pedobacter metabolipauper]